MSATDNTFHPKDRWDADKVISEADDGHSDAVGIHVAILRRTIRQMAWSHNQLISDLESEDLPISNDD